MMFNIDIEKIPEIKRITQQTHNSLMILWYANLYYIILLYLSYFSQWSNVKLWELRDVLILELTG